LGGNLYKKRIALSNRGKSAGARTILAYKENDKVFFLYGFKKNEKSNVSDKEKDSLKELAKLYLGLTNRQLLYAIKHKELIEVNYEKK